jgi:hypothetical protein
MGHCIDEDEGLTCDIHWQDDHCAQEDGARCGQCPAAQMLNLKDPKSSILK